MCVGVSVWLVWSGICVASACNTDTTPTQPHRNSNTHRTKNNMTNVVIQQHSRKLLMMVILMSKTCWAHKKWNKIASDIKLVFNSSKLYMFQTVPLSVIRSFSLYTQQRYMSYRYADSLQAGSGCSVLILLTSCQQLVSCTSVSFKQVYKFLLSIFVHHVLNVCLPNMKWH